MSPQEATLLVVSEAAEKGAASSVQHVTLDAVLVSSASSTCCCRCSGHCSRITGCCCAS